MNMLVGISAGGACYTAFPGDREAIEIVSNDPSLSSILDLMNLVPLLRPVGWRDHAELPLAR